MAKYVPDVKTQRWVVISPARTTRPDDGSKPDEAKGAAPPDLSAVASAKVEALAKGGCPFCPGNEALTPPEVYRIGPGEKDKPGWSIRVVPNKFPITDTHEVFIHSTSHTDNVEKLPTMHVAKLLSCYRDRYRAHVNDGHVLIFCNAGLHAGASLAHPHSQLVVVPKQINLDSLSREPINNLIEDNTHYVTYCPDFSQWPYEVWIAPKEEGHKYDDIKDEELKDLAEVFQRSLKRIETIYKRSPIKPKDRANDMFVYNYYISHSNNWFIRIVPRFIHRAGFELGTGLNVNIVESQVAAKELAQA